jgi:hypothetical protein
MSDKQSWDHSNPALIAIHCRHCKGGDVLRDAFAEWDVELQKWALGAVFDQGYCQDCDGEATLVARWMDGGGPVTDYDRYEDE